VRETGTSLASPLLEEGSPHHSRGRSLSKQREQATENGKVISDNSSEDEVERVGRQLVRCQIKPYAYEPIRRGQPPSQPRQEPLQAERAGNREW